MPFPDPSGYNLAMPTALTNATVGPFVTGVMLQQLLLGVFCVQAYDYWRIISPNDTFFNRMIVITLATLTVLQGIMDYISLYRSTVTYYGDFRKFDEQEWPLFWEIAVTAIVGSIAQIFFLKRCYVATKNKIIVVIIGLTVAASLVFGIMSSIEFQRITRLSLLPDISISITGWLAITAARDALVSIVLTYSILRSKTPLHRAEAAIAKVIRVNGETCAVATPIAVISLALYLALPGLSYHLLPQLIMGKMQAIWINK